MPTIGTQEVGHAPDLSTLEKLLLTSVKMVLETFTNNDASENERIRTLQCCLVAAVAAENHVIPLLFQKGDRVIDMEDRHGVVEFVHERLGAVELTVLLDGNTTAVRDAQTRFVEELAPPGVDLES